MTAQTSPTTEPRTQPSTWLGATRVTVLLSVLVLAWQYVTAGQLVGSGGLRELHAGGAIVLHVVMGLATVAAGLLWLRDGRPAWPAVLSAVVFVLSFVQAYTGDDGPLWIHVPGALVLTVGAVWVLAWSFTRSAATSRGPA